MTLRVRLFRLASAGRRGLLAAAAGVVLASPAVSAQQAPLPVLSPGDVLRITVVGKPEMSGEFEIAGDTTIAHPYFRNVRVAGAPFSEVEKRVGDYLRGYEANPQFLVEPLFRVSVTGEVRRPDLFVVRPEVTVLQALARAGGPTERGRLDRVHLVRRGTDRVLDLTRPELGDAQLTVSSGAQISVERRVSVFRDYIAPAGSVVAALASVARLFMK